MLRTTHQYIAGNENANCDALWSSRKFLDKVSVKILLLIYVREYGEVTTSSVVFLFSPTFPPSGLVLIQFTRSTKVQFCRRICSRI